MMHILKSASRTALALVLVLSFSLMPPTAMAAGPGAGGVESSTSLAGSANDSATLGETTPPGSELPPVSGLAPSGTDPQAPSTSDETPVPVATTYDVKFFDWDNTQIGTTQSITEGEAAVAPPDPYRQGYAFTGWDKSFSNVTSNLDIYAEYQELTSFSVTINYVFADSTIARQPIIFAVEKGDPLSKTVVSPTIAGYTPDQASVVINLTNVQEDHSYTVVYTAALNTPYKVLRYQQKLTLVNQSNPHDPANYNLVATENLAGATGALVTAPTLVYSGFSAPATMPSSQISADGTTTLRVYYDRNQYAIYFNSAGGTYVAPISGLFGATVSAPANPTRPGYTFGGWSSAVPGTMPANDLNLTATWVVSGTVSYTTAYYLENIAGTGYDYVGTAMRTGAAGSAPTIPGSIPSGITFPIAATHTTYNSTKTLAELPATVNGNGTTIVNVYYDRKSYSVNFQFNATKYNLIVNGTTYSTSPYTLTAKYGSNIETKWPGSPTLKSGASEGLFVGWQGNDINYVTKQYFMDDTIINNAPYTATWNTDSKNVTVYYYFRNLTGTGYTANYTQTVAVERNNTTWNAKAFQGFTVQQTPVDIQSNNTATFYYDRNQYQITYYNGGTIDHSTTASYQAAIGGPTFSAPPAVRPANIPSDYVFGGWYTTPQGLDNTKFNFTGATMPAYNLILYARWDKPTYTATFDADNGSPLTAQSAVALTTLTEPAAPTKAGYTFAGWYLPASSLKYTFSFPVTSNLYLKARWIPAQNISYDVIYQKQGVEYLRQTFGGRSVSDSVTANAIAIPGYLPDALSKSITLQASGNQIIFNYVPFTSEAYTVRYVTALGVDLRPMKQAATGQASVIENYIDIPGYYPDHYQQTLILSPTASENVITFVYSKNADASYIVRSMFENLDGSYSSTDVTKYAPAGSRALEVPQTVTGFAFEPSLSINDRVIASDNSTIIRMVYNRDLFIATFTAGAHGSLTGTTSFSNIKYDAPFATAVTVPTPQADPGYRFDSWTPALPNSGATVTASVSYAASFVKDDAQWATVTFVGNGNTGGTMAPSAEMLIGSTYTLPINTFTRSDYTFVNWDTLTAGTGISYADQATITVAGNTTLYAQWVEHDKFGVVYLGNGGTGTMTDPNSYYDGDPVLVLPNEFVNPGYAFQEWQDAGGATYVPNSSFNIQANTYLSAVWAYDPTQWAELTYDANNPAATGSMANEDILVGAPHTLTANAFALTHYTFQGWNTAPNGTGTPYAEGDSFVPTNFGSVTLYAQWQEIPQYTLTYMANNATPATTSVTDYQGAMTTILPSTTFSYANHDFVRWATNPDGTGDAYFAGSTVPLTQNVTLYAFWMERHLYTATYNDGFSGDSFSDAQYADPYGYLDMTVAANPFVRQGYAFVTWQSATGTADPGTVIYGVNSDLTFTARWTPLMNSITYNLDGGTVAGANPTSYTIETPSFDLINPTKPGYTFDGWTGTGLVGPLPIQAVTIGEGRWGDLVFTANWTKDPTQWATVTFAGNGSTGGTMAPSTEMLVGTSYTLPANAFTRTNYDFLSWDTLLAGTGVSYVDQATFTVTESVTLYAQWLEDNKYGVIYLGNGGTGTLTDADSYYDNDPVTVLPNSFMNPGYAFKEWKDIGGNSYAAGSTFNIHVNTYLYAEWEYDADQWAEVIYDANSPEATGSMASETVLVGEPHTLAMNAFSKPHWAFEGWNSVSDGSGTAYGDGESITPAMADQQTFYAQWSRVFYTATYYDGFDGNSFAENTQLNVDNELELIIAENPFTRTGYYFDYWEGENGEIVNPGDVITPIASNVTYTAVWSDVGYAIDYDLDGGTVAGTNPDRYRPDTPTFELINPTRPGYTFEGWTGTGFTTPTLTVEIVLGTEGRLSFTAHWIKDESQWSTITFVTSDPLQGELVGDLVFEGIKGDPTGVVPFNAFALMPFAALPAVVVYPTTVANGGYEFAAWSSVVPELYPDEDITIEANWKQAVMPLPDPSNASGGGANDAASGMAQTNDPWTGYVVVALGVGIVSLAALIVVTVRRKSSRR